MNRDEIVDRMGWMYTAHASMSDVIDRIERIVRAAENAEREECARVCESKAAPYNWGSENADRYRIQNEWAKHCAAAIRARGVDAALDAMTAENQRLGLYEDSENPMVKP